MIIIIDYGAGNLRSILGKLERLGAEAKISAKKTEIAQADKLILPGVGFFSEAMKHLEKSGLIPILNQKVLKEKTPILGICLGMQLFSEFSEEGDAKGLGWIKAKVRKFNFPGEDSYRRIPHMGWNSLKIIQKNPLLGKLGQCPEFYFVHSYHICPEDTRDVIATTNYGEDFVSAVAKDNIYGVQFHPEKSHTVGMKLLKNFVERT